ncbi:MAG TPA: glutathione S-transferase N-terminal domain-containing protein, partial [Plasticicumulans sp.]|nr:glutathione S-transferase N-terminal domain-containing protein [Plasticicumulans sp.]
MRLRYSPTSPFVRKISVAALELGLAERITRVPTNPWDPASDIAHDNPLGRIPALVLDDGSGTVLYDSPVIVEYLDALAGGRVEDGDLAGLDADAAAGGEDQDLALELVALGLDAEVQGRRDRVDAEAGLRVAELATCGERHPP